ncbi:MAG: RNA polymerase sigma factor [Chloroflexi bacterium]|nr:RNA polymerase sigma factor [Chloroflexota bacterium]
MMRDARPSGPDKPSRRDTAEGYAEIAELFEARYPSFVRYFVSRCGNLPEAEDLASELFDRLLRSAHHIAPVRPAMEAWLYVTAHNMAVDYFRRKGRLDKSTPFTEEVDSYSADNNYEAWDDKIDNKAALARVLAAMEQLSEGQRKVLSLRFMDGLAGAEIALLLKKKPGAVREMQRAGLEHLRLILRKRGDGQ